MPFHYIRIELKLFMIMECNLSVPTALIFGIEFGYLLRYIIAGKKADTPKK